jgi:uncharacterized protein (TIGR01777 family)
MMDILIAGGTGFIGKYLARHLKDQGHNVFILTRNLSYVSQHGISVIFWDGTCCNYHHPFDVIINLCGENIASNRWTAARKHTLISSRVNSTKAWHQYFTEHYQPLYDNRNPPLLLNASAVGFYANSDSEQHESKPLSITQPNFSQSLVNLWETQARSCETVGAKVSCLRFGVVLGKEGGILKKLLPSFRFGLGALIGNGHTHLSWIHIEDLCRAITHIINQKNIQPAYNLTSPKPCTQRQFANSIAKACGMPRLLKLSPWLIKKLFGEMGEQIMLANNNITPKHLQDSGFKFKFQDIQAALDRIIRGQP